MEFTAVREGLPDFARDIRLNLETVLDGEGAPGLAAAQIQAVALACAYSLGSERLIGAAGVGAEPALQEAAKAAAAIMAMNNVYYRAIHLMDDNELKVMPARLRMNVIGKPGIAKIDFELMCFAISALAGCGQCMSAHLKELRKAEVANDAAHSALRIASTLNAANTALRIAGN